MQRATHYSSLPGRWPRHLSSSVVSLFRPVLLCVGLALASVAPAAAITCDTIANTFEFGNQLVGTASPEQLVTSLSSIPGGTFGLTVVLENASPGEFVTTSSEVTVPAGGTFYVGVVFAPQSGGERSAILQITTPDSTFFCIPLLGNGIPAADLSVSISATPDPVKRGKNLTYTTILTNSGPSFASGVVLSQTLPGGSTLVSATATQGVLVANSGTGTLTLTLIPGLTPPSQVTLTVVVKVTARAKATVSSTVSVDSSTPDAVSSNDTATASTAVFGSHK